MANKNITLTISEELLKKMKKFSNIKWSAVARDAIAREIEKLELMDKLLSKSELTEEDAERIGHKIKHEMSKRFRHAVGH